MKWNNIFCIKKKRENLITFVCATGDFMCLHIQDLSHLSYEIALLEFIMKKRYYRSIFGRNFGKIMETEVHGTIIVAIIETNYSLSVSKMFC